MKSMKKKKLEKLKKQILLTMTLYNLSNREKTKKGRVSASFLH